ncbi:glycerophosphodiester phosphodiesterase [Neotamlana sedimentorum]|uniref:glycerophosphodiester phosphodiesterase n=1 Tax=Neotamlana sedimentorum TaxID=1435349 RepID=UPI000E426AB5
MVSPYFKLLNKTTVEDLQAQNYQVIPWTVNKTSNLEKMIALNVDGIITDYPDRLVALLNN